MTRRIDYYYVPISGYAYLGEPRLMAMAREFNTPVSFYPVNIGQVFQAAKVTAPAAQPPAKLAYRRLDLARTAERLGLPINAAPAHWPVDPGLACRVIYAAKDQGIDPHLVSFALLTAIYAKQQNIADPVQVGDILQGLGLDAEALIAQANQEDACTALQAATDRAISIGIAGSPTYVLEDEPFFGQDRLVDLHWRLASTA